MRWQGLGESGVLGVNERRNLTVSGRVRNLQGLGHLESWAWLGVVHILQILLGPAEKTGVEGVNCPPNLVSF